MQEFLVVQAPELAVPRHSHHPPACVRTVDARQRFLGRNPLHPEGSCLVVGGASEAPILAFHRSSLAPDRPIDAGRKTQGRLIRHHPRPIPQPLAALPAHLVVVVVGGAAAWTEGHVYSFFN